MNGHDCVSVKAYLLPRLQTICGSGLWFADPDVEQDGRRQRKEMIGIISNQQICYCQYSKKLNDSNRSQESDCISLYKYVYINV